MELQFLGAAKEVTGSCFLITLEKHKLLVDCGMIQGSPRDEARNQEAFPFDIHSIDAVVLSHAHLDHSGRLPLLIKSGYQGPIYTHHATRDLCQIMLKDAAYLSERDAEIDNRKRARKHLPPVEPLYTIEDAEKTIPFIQTLAYGEKQEILPGVTIRLADAGHILGSAIIEMWLKETGCQRKLVFSGDLGHPGAPILKDPSFIDEADLVIMESTYGERQHRPWKDTWQELQEALQIAATKGGNVLIPSFAIGRTQELLYVFHKHYKEWGMDHWHIFLDSPMAIEATKTYAKFPELYDAETKALIAEQGSPYKLPNLRLSQTSEDSMRLNQITSGAIIIAGSGMCSGGRIRHHLKYNVWRRDCHIFIVGFQARGTLGRALVDGAKEITLWGESIRVAAQIHTIGGLSAHADQAALLNWYQHFQHHPRVALIHGEEKSIAGLAAALKQQYGAEVWQPKIGDTIDLKHWR